MRKGIATLPLHGGKAPRWLFSRMKLLAREIVIALVSEYGPEEVLRRLSDPFWFQAFGCVLGFDWHSSGVTTTACGAVKEGIKDLGSDLGLFVAGGKGKVSRGTPAELTGIIERYGLPLDPEKLKYCSRMSAKVDSTALQDGYQIYHHCIFFTASGRWSVVQQGMNEETRYARRYHWLSETLNDFVVEPHNAVCCDAQGRVLNFVADESEKARQAITWLSREKPIHVLTELSKLPILELPEHHDVRSSDIDMNRVARILLATYEAQPLCFETLLGIPNVGPKTLRALSLISELVYDAPASIRDPARFSFAHGGKDGYPYPVDRKTYDRSIDLLRKALQAAKIGRTEKIEAFKRLNARECGRT